MHIPLLDLKRQLPPAQEAVEREAVGRVLSSGRYIHGPELAAFEKAFSEYLGVPHCIGAGNGTDALELALRAAAIQPGQEVATVANAGMYATTAIRAAGAIPLYVDIDPVNLLMSAASLEAALGPLTRAVVLTHLYGRMAPIEAVLEIAGRRGLTVIEDCAQAHGAALNGRKAGAWAPLGCFSFYPTKNLGAAGDAGAVVTPDPQLAARLRALREYGWTERFHSTVPGGRNSRMDEMQAAILAARLPRLDERNRLRRAIAARLSEALREVCDAVPCPAGDEHVFHLFVVRSRRRDALRQWLDGRGIDTAVHYPVPDHLQPSQRGLPFRAGPLEATETAAAQILTLPCFPDLRSEEVDWLVGSVIQWPR